MRFVGDCYRAHNPKWAFAALSGDGAASFGGRFNPPGIPALYLSLTIDGAFAEASQLFAAKLEPLTICLYEVDCDDVVDLRTKTAIETHDFDPAQIGCAWRVDEAQGRKPYTWHLAEVLIGRGASGVLVPSFAKTAQPDAFNLVLWRWGEQLPHRVWVHDPSERLPQDQLSWPAKR